MEILVVEDQPEFVLMLRSLLRGHTVIAYPNIWQCLHACKKTKFDLVLLDLVLQDSTALETLEKVKEIRELGSYNIVVMTGYDNVYDRQCHLMGLQVLHKGVDFPHKLVALLK